MKNQMRSAHGQPLAPSAEKSSKNSKQEQENQILTLNSVSYWNFHSLLMLESQM